MNITFIEQIDERSKTLINNLISYNKLDRTRLIEKIQMEFDTNPDISNPSAYVTRIVKTLDLSLYKRQKVDNSHVGFNTDAWIKKWDDDGFTGTYLDQLIIIRTYEFLLYDCDVLVDEILELKRKVEQYCIANNKMSLSEVADAIFKTKTVKLNKVDEAAIRKEAAETEELMNSLKERDEKLESDDDGLPFPITIEERNKLKEADGERLQDS